MNKLLTTVMKFTFVTHSYTLLRLSKMSRVLETPGIFLQLLDSLTFVPVHIFHKQLYDTLHPLRI